MNDLLTNEEEILLESVLNNSTTETTQDNNTDNNEESSTENNITSRLIPKNPDPELAKGTTSRFSGASWYEEIKKMNITIIGVGGIGSNVAFLVSRLRPCYITLYDDDNVEISNISGQFYSIIQMGKSKVVCMANNIRDFSNYYQIFTKQRKFDADSSLTNVTICGLDNMEARKTCFYRWVEHVQQTNPEECLFIDGRLSLEEFQVFAIQGNDIDAIKKYKEEWLFSSSEAEPTICSQKQTTFMASMIACTMTNILVNFAANRVGGIRPVPFYTNYNAETMYTKIEL